MSIEMLYFRVSLIPFRSFLLSYYIHCVPISIQMQSTNIPIYSAQMAKASFVSHYRAGWSQSREENARKARDVKRTQRIRATIINTTNHGHRMYIGAANICILCMQRVVYGVRWCDDPSFYKVSGLQAIDERTKAKQYIENCRNGK